MEVIKKDGKLEKWNNQKIITAIKKAASRACEHVDHDTMQSVLHDVEILFQGSQDKTTNAMHAIVINALRLNQCCKVADAYQGYRDYKNTYAAQFEQLKEDAEGVLHLGDRENANFDSSLTSTKGSVIRGYLTKSLYKQFFLSKQERELTQRGDIYIHDLRDMIFNNVNCCLFDIETVLNDGFEMSNVKYTEPKSVQTALNVIGDITLVATAQQFGGFTLAELDKVLVKYCHKTYHTKKQEMLEMLADHAMEVDCHPRILAHIAGLKAVKRELEQGFQSLELKLNTVPCSRGDFAFTTITFGHFNQDVLDRGDAQYETLIDLDNYSTDRDVHTINFDLLFQTMICDTILQTRMKGHGDVPVVFPKLVYLFSEKQYNNYSASARLFDHAVQCSSKCMYPDYLSIDGNPQYNAVAQTYLDDGAITSPMGCRAYLSPWKDPKTGKHVTIGRCNLGAVSFNIPVIIAYCKEQYKTQWKQHFWDELYQRMLVVREFFKKRYTAIANSSASSNPLAFTQGGFYKGFRGPDDKVGDLIQYMTASFGISALNEASILWTGKSLHEDSSFANQILDFMNDHIQQFKKQDGHLYALYGTPAESLCGTQAKQYCDYTGDHQFGEFFSNSFHLHVSEDITPFEKQNEEMKLFHKCNGGHIQYVRIDNPTNFEALKAVILRGMSMGFYQGVNFDAAYCFDCGKHSTNVLLKCPHCGSHNISVISRVCGYLGYSNVNGKSRMNDAKLARLNARVSM